MKTGSILTLTMCCALGWTPLRASAFKVYIFADMEGCTGIEHPSQLRGERAAEGVAATEGDINACVAACFEAGATAVVVRDGHGGGSNVAPERIDQRVELVRGGSGTNRYPRIEGAEAVILLGYHAKSLTPGGVLAHSYSSQAIQRMFLNGREVGEVGVDAVIAGEHGVPVVLVIGDDKTCAEAREWIPGVVTCVTKTGTGSQSANLLPADEARRRIREATLEALRRRRDIPPVRTEYPATLRWEWLPKGSRRTYDPEFVPVTDPRIEERTGDRVEALLLGPRR